MRLCCSTKPRLSQERVQRYSPTPQKVTYGEGVTKLQKPVNLIMGTIWIFILATAWRVYYKIIKSLIQSSRAAVAGTTNIYLGVHGQHSPGWKISEFLKDSLIRLMLMLCQSRTVQSLSSVKIQMLSSMDWRLLNTCLMKLKLPVLRNLNCWRLRWD